MIDDQPELHERITAGRLLSLAAARASEHMSAFGNWLLIGVGAAYSLVVVNLASIQKFVSLSSIRAGLILLLAVIVLGVLQRWLAAIIASGAAAGEHAEKIGHELAEQDIDIDFKVVLREMKRGTYYPARWIVQSSFEKAMEGDYAASGRMSAALSQIHSLLVFFEAAFAVAAVAVTACGVQV